MRLLSFLIMFCLSAATTLHALNVESEAGALASALGADRGVTALTVSGTADASDLFFIADSLPALTSLDISALEIVPYHGRKIKGSTAYPTATIPAGAFGGSHLEYVVLPQGVTIGEMAFASSGLRAVQLPAGSHVMAGSFADCRALTTVSIAPDVVLGADAFRNCTALATASLGGISSIPEGTFAGCTSLSTVNGTSGIKDIGKEAFARTSSLKSFSFPEGLAAIGVRAFAGSGLEEAGLPASVSEIGREAFFGCPGLRKVVLPASLATLGDYVFANSPVAGLTLPRNLKTIGRFALRSTALVAVDLPASLESIGDGAMEAMNELLAIDVSALEAVPATGEAVWAGVDVSGVKLYVGTDKAGFASAHQWQDFEIVSGSGSAEAPLAPESGVFASFSDGILTLVSAGADISRVLVYKISGERVLDMAPGAPSCVTDLRSLPAGSIIAVAAILTDGTRSIFKFAL